MAKLNCCYRCEVGIVLFTQRMTAVRGILFRTNYEDIFLNVEYCIAKFIWCFSDNHPSPVKMHLKTYHEILVFELIGDCCSQQRVGRDSVHLNCLNADALSGIIYLVKKMTNM